MLLTSIERISAHNARKRKMDASKDGLAEVPPLIQMFRGDDVIALIYMADFNKTDMMDAVLLSAAGFDADAVSITTESYVAQAGSMPTDTFTGKPLARTYEELALEHDGVAKGWVMECVTVITANRAGDDGVLLLPFRYTNGTLIWDQPVCGVGSAQSSGHMSQTLAKIMSVPSLSVVFAWDGAEQSRAERDLAVAQALMTRFSCQVGLVLESTQHDRREVFAGMGDFVEVRQVDLDDVAFQEPGQ